jgi:hypothetical protein
MKLRKYGDPGEAFLNLSISFSTSSFKVSIEWPRHIKYIMVTVAIKKRE